jgi:hypothetical protein
LALFRSADASRLLESRPTVSAVLGALFVVLCGLFVSGRLPRDPVAVAVGERYVIAASCLIVAAYFFNRAYVGWRK